MKVISIKQPWASLIIAGYKVYEFRTWKTKYRGELYIQASVAKLSKDIKERKELMKLFDENCLSYGKIICKCKLVDCIYMTEEFIEEEKKGAEIQYLFLSTFLSVIC